MRRLGPRLFPPILALLLVPALSGTAVERAASIPLPEHPRPDFERAEWVNLNGDWAFRFDAYTPSTRLPDNVRITGSIATVLHVTRHLRFILEYDHARDTIRPDGDAAKPFRHVSQGSVMMEARF